MVETLTAGPTGPGGPGKPAEPFTEETQYRINTALCIVVVVHE